MQNFQADFFFVELGNQSQLIYLNFDRISGETVLDDSGYANDGTLINFSQLARDAGKCGHGIRFQGGTFSFLYCVEKTIDLVLFVKRRIFSA